MPGCWLHPLTQMCHAAEARVEADLSHLVGARQEEVNHAVGDHAAWEAKELVVKAAPLPEAVPTAWGTRIHSQQLPVQRRPLQHVHKPLQPRARGEDEVIVHPQHILGGYLGHSQIPSCEPALGVRGGGLYGFKV